MSPGEVRQWVLNGIASGEASRYDELYGGSSFSGYGDHPRRSIPIGDGRSTTAAGRYQFLSSTWDAQKARLGLTDFSPASQDSAAWDLAQRVYKQQTGRDITDDASAGKMDWRALGGTWTSLAGKRSDLGGAPSVSADSPMASGGTAEEPPVQPTDGSSPASSVNPMAMLQALAPHLQFTPVDYDPFAIAATGNGDMRANG